MTDWYCEGFVVGEDELACFYLTREMNNICFVKSLSCLATGEQHLSCISVSVWKQQVELGKPRNSTGS